jgi:hypothetical protein
MMETMSPERARRLPRVAAVVAPCVIITAMLVDACVIADPPSELVSLPEGRPTILRSSVVPSASSVLGRWPTKFIIPVELREARSTIFAAAFVDYNAVTGEGFEPPVLTSKYEPSTTNGLIRTLEIPITIPSLDRCHVVEVVVALRLNTSDSRNVHTPLAPGGDIVSWFFSPSGDLSGCPVLDAGLAPITGDAEAGAEGGVEAGGTEQ